MFLPYQLIGLLILYLGLPWSIYHIFTSHQFYRLIGHHSCHVSPFNLSLYSLGFLDPLTFSLPLFTPMGLLLNSLGFLSYLLRLYLLLFLWAYWSLFLPRQPIEFTTLFLGLSPSIYFFFTSHYSHNLNTSFLGHPWAIYFFFTSCYFHGSTGYQSYHFSSLDLFLYFFTILPLVFFSSSYCWASSVVGLFVKKVSTCYNFIS